ncbi:hypothetical protein DRJ25_03920 [Candidatus Woesearchaeota archaeon]|nr:MAG: hypothetical protein DRJ25_03920 [Candidatus Woesearchaeota archaeon]
MKTKEVIILFLLINICIAFAAELTIEPEKINAKTSETITACIKLNNNQSIYGADFRVNKPQGMSLTNYEFLNRTNNSMTSMKELKNEIRFGILFSPNSTGLKAGDDCIIKLTYNATRTSNTELNLTGVFLSDAKGQEIHATTKGSNITITQPSAHLSCSDKIAYQGETTKINIYAKTNNTNIGGIDFTQEYDSRLSYMTASLPQSLSAAMLATHPSSKKIRFAIANMNITGTNHILTINYDIIGSSGISVLNFKDITISDTEGNLITTTSENCNIEIEKFPSPPSAAGSGGGGGGSSKKTDKKKTKASTEAPASAQDYYSSFTDAKKETKEPVFTTQNQEKKEETRTEKPEKKTIKKKTGTKSLPLALISLTALIGLGVVLLFQLKK